MSAPSTLTLLIWCSLCEHREPVHCWYNVLYMFTADLDIVDMMFYMCAPSALTLLICVLRESCHCWYDVLYMCSVHLAIVDMMSYMCAPSILTLLMCTPWTLTLLIWCSICVLCAPWHCWYDVLYVCSVHLDIVDMMSYMCAPSTLTLLIWCSICVVRQPWHCWYDVLYVLSVNLDIVDMIF